MSNFIDAGGPGLSECTRLLVKGICLPEETNLVATPEEVIVGNAALIVRGEDGAVCGQVKPLNQGVHSATEGCALCPGPVSFQDEVSLRLEARAIVLPHLGVIHELELLVAIVERKCWLCDGVSAGGRHG